MKDHAYKYRRKMVIELIEIKSIETCIIIIISKLDIYITTR